MEVQSHNSHSMQSSVSSSHSLQNDAWEISYKCDQTLQTVDSLTIKALDKNFKRSFRLSTIPDDLGEQLYSKFDSLLKSNLTSSTQVTKFLTAIEASMHAYSRSNNTDLLFDAMLEEAWASNTQVGSGVTIVPLPHGISDILSKELSVGYTITEWQQRFDSMLPTVNTIKLEFIDQPFGISVSSISHAGDQAEYFIEVNRGFIWSDSGLVKRNQIAQRIFEEVSTSSFDDCLYTIELIEGKQNPWIEEDEDFESVGIALREHQARDLAPIEDVEQQVERRLGDCLLRLYKIDESLYLHIYAGTHADAEEIRYEIAIDRLDTEDLDQLLDSLVNNYLVLMSDADSCIAESAVEHFENDAKRKWRTGAGYNLFMQQLLSYVETQFPEISWGYSGEYQDTAMVVDVLKGQEHGYLKIPGKAAFEFSKVFVALNQAGEGRLKLENKLGGVIEYALPELSGSADFADLRLERSLAIQNLIKTIVEAPERVVLLADDYFGNPISVDKFPYSRITNDLSAYRNLGVLIDAQTRTKFETGTAFRSWQCVQGEQDTYRANFQARGHSFFSFEVDRQGIRAVELSGAKAHWLGAYIEPIRFYVAEDQPRISLNQSGLLNLLVELNKLGETRRYDMSTKSRPAYTSLLVYQLLSDTFPKIS